MFSEYSTGTHRFVLMTDLLNSFYKMRDLLNTIGLDIEMTAGWRGEKEQNEFKSKGVSNAAWGSSPHNFGAAFDIVPVVNGNKTYEIADIIWMKIGFAGEKFGIQWGYDWDGDGIVNDKDATPGSKFDDRPHFQVKNWKEKGFKLYEEEPPIG